MEAAKEKAKSAVSDIADLEDALDEAESKVSFFLLFKLFNLQVIMKDSQGESHSDRAHSCYSGYITTPCFDSGIR